ncbi:MAG TPA: nitroreductase family protein [Methylibium sp.]|nr:nitroreductase family protein [Methylibium sp.]
MSAAPAGPRPDPDGAEVSDALELLALRYSVGPKFLVSPAPTPAQWRRAAALAQRAPDHDGLRPFRFVVVADGQRAALAELFAQDAIRRGHAPAEVAKARARAYNGPGLAALVGRVRTDVDDVPAHEQWVCIGAALMNFLNALHLMGFGAKALSGTSVAAPAIQSAFCRDGETLVTWVVAGRPVRAAHPRHDEAAPLIGDWAPPSATTAP